MASNPTYFAISIIDENHYIIVRLGRPDFRGKNTLPIAWSGEIVWIKTALQAWMLSERIFHFHNSKNRQTNYK